MNASLEQANVQLSSPSDGLTGGLASGPSAGAQPGLATQTSLARETAPAPDDKICWIELRQVPYPPDQQVELLHLQAEAEALLLQLQAMHQRRNVARGGVIEASQA